ncbi:formylglycine-generating enzyme family protein [Synechococcus sp. CCY 9618]|uniref:formylglycine-generating enzyme family protein n=1 Tax=Synechococcus sp. CCY 9618 TaxID=2815602 RepID=UPI00352C40D4
MAALLVLLTLGQGLAIMVVRPMPALAAEMCPAGMVPIPGGRYRIGAAGRLPEEAEAPVRLRPFCLGQTEVTNRQFAAFAAATGYRTQAERPLPAEPFPELSAAERRPGSVVFHPPAPGEPVQELSWWRWVPGADWRHPEGPGSTIEERLDHPVVQVSLEDAEAYAAWAGAALPSEAQWEFAARGGLKDRAFSWGDTWKPGQANTWQGEFPLSNTGEDGYLGTAPVGRFPANGYGLHDMTGNVWEWTADWYRPGHERLAGQEDPRLADPSASSDPRDPGVAKHVIKGGSFLCAPNFCSRYRPAAREAESPDTGTSHIGFRLVSPSLTTHG